MSFRSVPSSAELDALTEVGVVSRETILRLAAYVNELSRWQAVTNLVSTATLHDVWMRHIVDSAQLFMIERDKKTWLDLGSGGGLPGVILGILLAETGGHIHLIEANSKKCAFLRHAVRMSGAAATVHNGRIEALINEFSGVTDVVTGRAVAALPQLIDWSKDLLRNGTTALFPKGKHVETELTDTFKDWIMEYDLIVSRTDSSARIVRVRSIEEVCNVGKHCR